ncbi:MAG: XdhC family protein [Oscillospiraceae bacterium]|nr:XdhC family protein [Oscillospiraceae bacterium]
MRKLFKALGEAVRQGDAVLVSIVAGDGAAPRGAGARMIVGPSGRVTGTIGGGAVEYRSEQIALDVLKSRETATHKFTLQPDDVANLGMVCGGRVEVYFRYIPANDEKILALTDRIEALFAAGEPCWIVMELSSGETGVFGEKSGAFGVDVPDEVIAQRTVKPRQIASGDRLYYCEQLLRPGRVFIFGGGHVSQALVPALSRVDFRCIVCEDRPDFTRRELFPDAEEIRLMDMSELSAVASEINEYDYICIVTRGHKNDLDVQRAMMTTKARYIGVIGSANKQRFVKEKLMEYGFREEDFKNVVSPIGLPIGAVTPEEIAVSVASQLIMVRAGKGATL